MHVRIFFREKLKQMIEACKALHENFDERRREVRAEKQKKIRELTDPNHAWDSPLESEQPAAAVAVEPVMTPVDEQPAAAAVVPTAATAAAPADAVPGYYQYQVREPTLNSFYSWPLLWISKIFEIVAGKGVHDIYLLLSGSVTSL